MTDLTALIAAAGADAVTLPAAPSPGGPPGGARPAAPATAAAVPPRAAAAGCAVLPRGRGTRPWPEPAPGRAFVVVSTERLAARAELDADNLSATFAAGLPLAAVAAALVPAGLYCPPLAHLPLDDPDDDSLGGAVARRLCGPERARHGPLRNWVLALQVVTPGGEVVGLGAPTVKNVAGYDLVKLHIGAGGTLGLITAVTLRLLKLPPEQVTLAAAFASCSAAIAALQDLAATANAPTAAELLGGIASFGGLGVPPGGALALVELAGAATAPWQAAVAAALAAAGGDRHGLPASAWAEYARLPRALARERPLRLRAAVPPPAAVVLWSAATAADAAIIFGPITGTAELWVSAGADLARLRQALVAVGGYLEPAGGPAAAALPATAPGALDLALRRALDPAGVMQ